MTVHFTHPNRTVTHVGGDQMNLGVSVLSGLGGRHVDDLAWSSLDDDVTVLPQSGTLHGEGGGGAGGCV